MDEEWIKVFETTKMHQALIVQSILKEHEIESVILNQQSSTYITIGEIQVMVKLEDSIEALNIIDKEIS
jgi:Putative prokaryotic signal transducing protein